MDYEYKVKIRTYCGSYEDFYDNCMTVSIPDNIQNVDGYLSYTFGITKGKDEKIEILSYELIE